MDELIVFLLFGWMEFLIPSNNRNSGGFILAWLVVLCICVGIFVLISSHSSDSEQTHPEQPPTYSSTEKSFIELCESRDGIVSRDLNDSEKLICL